MRMFSKETVYSVGFQRIFVLGNKAHEEVTRVALRFQMEDGRSTEIVLSPQMDSFISLEAICKYLVNL